MSSYETLTKKFKEEPGFFEVSKFPKSSFVATSITAGGDPSVAGSTHIVVGNLQIRDVTKSIKFPATIAVTTDAVTFKAEFTIGRHDFGIQYEGGSLYPDIRENVLINISSKIPRATIAGTGQSNVKKVDDKPRAFEAFSETIPDSLIKFEMRPVQGDAATHIKPFFIGKTEVTWDEYSYWAFMYDQQSEAKKIQMRSKKLRPSAPYHEADHGFGFKDHPAVGMSLIAAQNYCNWLSEKTGKTYRLPTKQEWLLAYKEGGQDPAVVPDHVTDIAWVSDNSEEKTHEPAKLKPNKLGLYDMLGNAAEYVLADGGKSIVMGGDYRTGAADIKGETEEAEDWTWTENDPSDPKSYWWKVDAGWVGFRIVCEQ